MHMTHEPLEAHQSFVRDCRADSLLEVAAVKQHLCSGQYIRVQHVTWVTPALDVSGIPWEIARHCDDLVTGPFQDGVRFAEGPNKLRPMSKI